MKKFLLFFICSSLAADPVVLNEGQKAPYEGLLFTTGSANALRLKVVERDSFEIINKSLEKSLSITEHNYSIEQEKNGILNQQNEKLAKSLQDSNNTSSFEKWLYIGLGAAAVIFGAIVVKKVNN